MQRNVSKRLQRSSRRERSKDHCSTRVGTSLRVILLNLISPRSWLAIDTQKERRDRQREGQRVSRDTFRPFGRFWLTALRETPNEIVRSEAEIFSFCALWFAITPLGDSKINAFRTGRTRKAVSSCADGAIKMEIAKTIWGFLAKLSRSSRDRISIFPPEKVSRSLTHDCLLLGRINGQAISRF